jgi:hypothetical protein
MSLATQSLKLTSIEAARLWRDLHQAEDKTEIDQLFQSLWQAQISQEIAADIVANLADQLDAELAAVKARMEHLISIHKTAIAKLNQWRCRLDQTILDLNEQGAISQEIAGKQRRIAIKENPPTCEILVEPSQLPEEYQRTKIIVNADKKAIIAAWKQGIPVDGTRVYRQRKVVYGLLKSSNFQDFQSQDM